ncbi:MAG: C25 family cysteine peptidase, partial [Bacteroidota bacterium]
MVTKHFERNLFRYSGTTPEEVVDDGDVPGEGWYWDLYYPARQIDYALALDTIDVLQGPNAMVRAWFYGVTISSQPPPESHRVRITINQSVVGEQGFAQRTGMLFNATFPAAQLNNGTNVVTIYSVPTTVPVQQFDFDWIEIYYRRFLSAKNNQLMFSFGPVPGGAPVMFTASNFTSPQIYVFDLTGRRQITGGTITGSGSTGYSIAFKDTLSVSKRYMVVSSPGQLSVPPLQKKQFSDIRVNTLGADYLVITHRTFKTAANQLAAHRHALNGVRTAVVDVQDIYDEFNYGVFNGDSVKSFVKYAYERWPTPAPAYLLIFGDASPDPQKWDPLTTSVNFISGHGGYPTGDNWFACFDTARPFLPSLLIGRIPVADSVHASRMVSKVMDYENYPVGAWNKSTLAITGPQTVSEMISFAFLSDGTISSYLAPPPLGMNTHRAYRTSIQPLVFIDNSKKQYMHDIVNNGVVLINYLGHAAGQTLVLDFGSPHDLQNTNRQWPFVMSVSCNIGAYTTRYGRTLGEDFVLADNRGGIAMWGASGAGYAGAGTLLVNFCLRSVADSIRDFGTLTTLARYRLWQLSPSFYTYILQVKLTPLLGDPLSKLAIPLKPDLALTANAITLERGYAANDSLSTIKVNVSNYGLVPADSVALRLTDTFNGQAFTIVNDKKLAPTR